jgi:serine/threonine-protein kinase
MYEGKYAEAERILRDSLAIQLEHDPPASIKVKTAQALLGNVLRLQHRHVEAVASLTEATTFPAPLQDNNSWRPLALSRLSEAQLDAGDAAAALATAQSALDYSRKAFTPDHFRNGFALYAVARAELALGRAADAELLLREALKVRAATHPPTHPNVLEVEATLAQSLTTQGKSTEARALAVQIEPWLRASSSPYAAELLARLAARQEHR